MGSLINLRNHSTGDFGLQPGTLQGVKFGLEEGLVKGYLKNKNSAEQRLLQKMAR